MLNERVITKAQHKLTFQLHFLCINLCNILSPHRAISACLFLHLNANINVQRMGKPTLCTCRSLKPHIVFLLYIEFVILFQKLLPAVVDARIDHSHSTQLYSFAFVVFCIRLLLDGFNQTETLNPFSYKTKRTNELKCVDCVSVC